MVRSRSYDGEPKANAEFKREQRDPKYRRELKRLIESGISRSSARFAARAVVLKPKVNEPKVRNTATEA